MVPLIGTFGALMSINHMNTALMSAYVYCFSIVFLQYACMDVSVFISASALFF